MKKTITNPGLRLEKEVEVKFNCKDTSVVAKDNENYLTCCDHQSYLSSPMTIGF